MIASSLVYSCKKEKVPVEVVDPNCIDTVRFATQIEPMIVANCIGCHDIGNSTGYTFTNHTNISTNATAILSAINGSPQLMPLGGPALNDSLIQQFSCWLDQGKLNN